jgi:hypothetical protein
MSDWLWNSNEKPMRLLDAARVGDIAGVDGVLADYAERIVS